MDDVFEFIMAAGYWIGWLVLWLALMAGFFYLVYFLISLPLRRQERARFILDLIEMGLREGRSVEQTIVEVSRTQESSVGVRFHLLAAYLENGLSLERALAKVPRLLPASVVATLKIGGEIGDLSKVLAACGQMLGDASSQVRKAQNYIILLAFVVTPAGMFIVPLLCIYVIPKFLEIFKDMEVTPSPILEILAGHYRWWVVLQAIVMVSVWLAALIYVGGPRLISWVEMGLPRFSDHVFMRIPWWRKRMQRDFAAMLAILLDAGAPEDKAVELAARATANHVFEARARRVVEDLRRGVALTEAVRHLDDAGEFRWRLANAARGTGGFRLALAGWQEALDARAFQLEHAAAQSFTTALVLINGVMVGLIVIALFYSLTLVIWSGLLW